MCVYVQCAYVCIHVHTLAFTLQSYKYYSHIRNYILNIRIYIVLHLLFCLSPPVGNVTSCSCLSPHSVILYSSPRPSYTPPHTTSSTVWPASATTTPLSILDCPTSTSRLNHVNLLFDCTHVWQHIHLVGPLEAAILPILSSVAKSMQRQS